MTKILCTYPKLLTLLLCTVAAYALARMGMFHAIAEDVGSFGLLGMFIGGLFFSFGFTTPFAIGYFAAEAHAVPVFLGSICGALGAATMDMGIYSLARFSLKPELDRLSHTRLLMRLWRLLHRVPFPANIRMYLSWSFGGLLIASPLPDEFGMILLSRIRDIEPKYLVPFCVLLNMLGIAAILSLAQMG